MLLVLGATFGWALSGLFLRLVENKDPWQVNALRGLSLAFCLLVWGLLRYGRRLPRAFAAIPWQPLLLCPLFFVVGSTLYLWALSLTSVAAASCLGATGPLFAAGLARLLLGERSPPAVLLAAVLALLGVAVMVWDGLQPQPGTLPLTWLGLAVSLGYAFCFAGQTVSLRRYADFDVVPVFILAGLATALAIFALRGLDPVSLHDLVVVGLMGLLQLAIPIALYARGARYLPAVTLMLITLLDTVLNPFFAWLAVGETPSGSTVLGGAVIVGAVALAVLARARVRTGSP